MKSLRGISICLLVGVLLCLALTFSGTAAIGEKEGPSALFINVGKADCALLFVEGRRYLVDTGTKGSAEAMLQALNTYEVTALDGVFITHTDKDHVGGLKKLLKSDVKVSQLYAPKHHNEKSDEDHPVFEASEKYEIPMTWLSAGDQVEIDENNRFAVLGPMSRDEDKENNNSLVMDLQTPHGNILLAGDMEFPEEEELLAAGVIPKATVLKVGNHAEDDASSRLLLATVRPQWAVISTNTEEEPDTPSSRVLKLLWDVKASIAVTQDATCGIYVKLWEGNASAEKIDYLP